MSAIKDNLISIKDRIMNLPYFAKAFYGTIVGVAGGFATVEFIWSDLDIRTKAIGVMGSLIVSSVLSVSIINSNKKHEEQLVNYHTGAYYIGMLSTFLIRHN